MVSDIRCFKKKLGEVVLVRVTRGFSSRGIKGGGLISSLSTMTLININDVNNAGIVGVSPKDGCQEHDWRSNRSLLKICFLWHKKLTYCKNEIIMLIIMKHF